MSINKIITGIKDDIKLVLPGLIEKYYQPPIEDFTIGYPFNQEKRTCSLRLAKLEFMGDFEFIIHLSLPKIDEDAAYDYLQAVCDYLTDFDTTDYGFYTGSYTLDLYESDFNHGDIQALFSVTLKKAVTDCDIGVGA
jgi:hypothetical protein